ncbi:MAG TPA: 16S rRNA (cytosine(967)-C(5))-methyltransferase RsmB [Kofleriaceae bacterium]|nr:16S rRNA (cytosine(967)-C(5))-methyltransferase RsmB [Kofleriaceae bacterium]
MNARELARGVLGKVETQGAWATPALGAALAKTREIDPRDRRLAAELVYGVLRHQSRLDRALAAYADLRKTPRPIVIALRVAAYQLLVLDRIPAHAAVDDAVEAAKKISPKLGGFANAVLRRLAAAGEPPIPAGDRKVRLEIAHSMPRWIVDEVARALGPAADRELDDAIAALSGTDKAPSLWLRANLRRTRRDALASAIAPLVDREPQASDAVPTALDATGLADPESAAPLVDGLASVQDVAAQLVAYLCDPKPGMRILDACAGHGGKATHLAELADDRASIDAADSHADKLARLGASAKRLGLTSIRTIPTDAEKAGSALAAQYDLVLLDAPCTGLGVIRRHPEAKWRLRPTDPAGAAVHQRALLDACAARVAPGGALVYGVCSFTLVEGPAQIDDFLARHPDFTLAPPPAHDQLIWPADDRGRIHAWPHRLGGDAFFAARLVRAP